MPVLSCDSIPNFVEGYYLEFLKILTLISGQFTTYMYKKLLGGKLRNEKDVLEKLFTIILLIAFNKQASWGVILRGR